MDEPEFYRDDLQAYYDMRIGQGDDRDEALAALRKKFKLKKPITLTPTGEVRVDGVTDDPDPPKAGPPMPPALPMPPGGEPEKEEPGSQIGAENTKPKPKAESLSEAVTRMQRRADRNEALAKAARYSRFQRLVNMRPRELREYLSSDALKGVESNARRGKTEGIRSGRAASRWIVRLKGTAVEAWTADMWEWCDRVTSFIERLRRNGAPVIDEGRPTRKAHTLRAWGHDPLRESVIDIADLDELYTFDRSIGMRLVDATATNGPVQIVESVKAPPFDVLKSRRKPLSGDERALCLSRKAVWHHGPDGGATPAVWKAEVGDSTWYVTNTHRTWAAARSVEGAISKYHSHVKQSA